MWESGIELIDWPMGAKWREPVCLIYLVFLEYRDAIPKNYLFIHLKILIINHHNKCFLSILCCLFAKRMLLMILFNFLYKPYKVNRIIIPTFQMRKLRLRKVKKCVWLNPVSGRSGIWANLSDFYNVAQFAGNLIFWMNFWLSQI